MKEIKYIIYKEANFFVAQCLNVDVSSFGDTVDEAIANITEAVELYLEDNDPNDFLPVDMALIGEKVIHA